MQLNSNEECTSRLLFLRPVFVSFGLASFCFFFSRFWTLNQGFPISILPRTELCVHLKPTYRDFVSIGKSVPKNYLVCLLFLRNQIPNQVDRQETFIETPLKAICHSVRKNKPIIQFPIPDIRLRPVLPESPRRQ